MNSHIQTQVLICQFLFMCWKAVKMQKKKKRSCFNNTCILEQKGEQLLKTKKYSMKSNNKFYR